MFLIRKEGNVEKQTMRIETIRQTIEQKLTKVIKWRIGSCCGFAEKGLKKKQIVFPPNLTPFNVCLFLLPPPSLRNVLQESTAAWIWLKGVSKKNGRGYWENVCYWHKAYRNFFKAGYCNYLLKSSETILLHIHRECSIACFSGAKTANL